MAPPPLSVLERFGSYTGERTPEALAGLFSGLSAGDVRQLPQIALSDGRTVVVIAARLPAADGTAIGFSIEGGAQLGVKKLKVNEWEIRAMPDKGTSTMALMVMKEGKATRYPLAVAPPLPTETDLSEMGFINYLRARNETAGTVQSDLNRDGKKDYLDDYIFTANYLIKQGTSGRSLEARRQRALQRTLSAPNSLPKPEPRKQYDGVFYGSPD